MARFLRNERSGRWLGKSTDYRTNETIELPRVGVNEETDPRFAIPSTEHSRDRGDLEIARYRKWEARGGDNGALYRRRDRCRYGGSLLCTPRENRSRDKSEHPRTYVAT